MEFFAHIFIGKEFAEIVSNISKQVINNRGEEILSSINLFLIDGKTLNTMSYPTDSISAINTVTDSSSAYPTLQSIEAFIPEKKEELTDYFIANIFDKILRVSNAGARAVLRVIFHFPLYKKESYEYATKLYSAIAASKRSVQINFMAYCDDLVEIIEPSYKIVSPSKKQIENFISFREKEKIPYQNHFFAIQNSSQNGISLGLDTMSLSNIIGNCVLLFAEHFSIILPPTMDYKDVLSFGISTLYLDKYLYVKYLMNKAMLNAMDYVKVNETSVNVNEAYNNANAVFFEKSHFLSTLHQEITDKERNDTNATLAKTTRTEVFDEDKVFSEIHSKFKDEINEILKKTEGILASCKSINMQAAILAVCLAKTDCELFSDVVFTQDIVTVDKMFDESIDYFIENDKAGYFFKDGEKPVNPIKLIKDIDTSLVNSETEVRKLENQLKSYEGQISDSENVANCYVEDGFYNYKGQKFRLLPSGEQEPLKETYTPHEITVTSLDLRSKFGPAKNQGNQGSCLSFSLTSIFEYVMKLNSAEDYDLSEAFLYYNARLMDYTEGVNTNTDSGARLKPAIDSLLKYGIALEKVWPYKEEIYSLKPSEAAYKDAAQRKLISAMNVSHKVTDIKSALVDGCPVAVSLILTKSFFNAINGYVAMPSEQEIDECLADGEKQNKHSSHAMVIVGFSDDLQMFIVRNSWGTDWGDRGYCYIPYSYIENTRLINYACIITEIASFPSKKIDIVVEPLKIDTKDIAIQYVITRVALDRESHLIEDLKAKKFALREYFEEQKQLFSNANHRDGFIVANTKKITEEQEFIREKVKKKQKELEKVDEEYNVYRKHTYLKGVCFLFGTLFFSLFYNRMILHILTATAKEWLAWGLLLVGFSVASVLLRKKSFIPSFWLSSLSVAGALAGKLLFGIIGIFMDNRTLTEHLESMNWSIQWYWVLIVMAAGVAIIYFAAHKRWCLWKDDSSALARIISKLQSDDKTKENEKKLLKLKTFSASYLIAELQILQRTLHSQYANLISLINNLRTWYTEFEQSENDCSFDNVIPDIQLLSEKQLDIFFDKNIKEDDEFHIDFCKDVADFHISEASMREYKRKLCEKIIDKLLSKREISEFNISAHIAENSFAEIAMDADRKLGNLLDERAGIFLAVNSSERGVIVQSASVFAPSASLYRDVLSRKLFGNSSLSVIDTNDNYKLTMLKVVSLNFSECVNFQ